MGRLLPGRGVEEDVQLLDDYLWALTYKWAVYSHANKSKRWVAARYFGKFNKFRNNRWVFGDAASGAYLAGLPGLTSSGTSWSKAGRLLTTRR